MVTFFGDGATSQGDINESFVFAAVNQSPIVVFCQNNQWAISEPNERQSRIPLYLRARGFGFPGVRVDGMDILAVRETVAEHVRIAREERRPTIVEAFTYRYRGHSAADPEVYRDKHEVEEWQRRDPIEIFARRLIEAGTITEDDLASIREQVEAEVLEAVEFADASPEPPLDSLYDNLYVFEKEHEGWYAVDERTPDPFRGEREREAAEDERVRELHEAGAAYGGQSPRSGGGSGEGPAEETDAPADSAQSEEEGEVDAEQAAESRQQGPGGIG